MGTVDSATTGILLLDKPLGPTSHDLVSRVRRLAGTRKVGHAGTLDPQASGLMILGVDAATRLLTYLVGLDKTYLTTVRLGVSTTTDDAEGAFLGEPVPVTDEALARLPAALAALTGDVDQVPSSVSAIHVDGRRAHEIVREGGTVDLPVRRVRIDRLELLDRRGADLDLAVDCSSGTYVRAIARDLGAALGTGAHVTALRRTRVGPFVVADAAPLEAPLRLLTPADAASALFPVRHLDHDEATALAQGKRVRPAGPGEDAPCVAALDPDGALIGLARQTGGELAVLVNLPRAVQAVP